MRVIQTVQTIFISLFVGMVIGAIGALLLSPVSGKELRARISREAKAERRQVQAGYEKARREIQGRFDNRQNKKKSESAADPSSPEEG